MTRIRLGFVIFLFFAGAVVVFLYLSRKKIQQAPTQQTPESVAISPPLFPTLETISREPAYDVSQVTGAFPDSLPVYLATKEPTLRATAIRYAQAFAVSGEPTPLPIAGGTIYSWLMDDISFSVGGNPPNIAYITQLPLSTARIADTEQAYHVLSQAALEKYGLVPAGAMLSQPIITYLAPKGTAPVQVDRSEATVIQLEYRVFLDTSYPLVAGYPDIATYRLWFDGTKKLLRLSALYFPPIQKTDKIVQLVSLDEAKQKLTSGGGALLATFSQADKNSDITNQYQFQTATITSTTLAYYYQPNSTVLTPVYVFFGKALDKKTGKNVDTMSLVAAGR